MFDNPTSTPALGIEMDGSFLKAVQLSMQRGKPILDQVFAIELGQQGNSSTEHHSSLEVNEEGHLLSQRANQYLVATALPCSHVLVRPLDINVKKEKDMDAVLGFQAEPLLPYPLENAILDRIKLFKSKDGIRLTLLAARKDHIQQHLNLWNNLQIDPEVISSEASALAKFSRHFISTDDPYFVIHLAKKQTACILVKEGKLLAAQAHHMGVDELKTSVNNEPFDDSLDFAELNSENHPALFQQYEQWQMETLRLLYALSKQVRDQEIASVLLTGEGAVLKNFGEKFCQRINKQLLTVSTMPGFTLPPSELQRFAIPIGAALTGLPSQDEQVNFRKQEFAYPQPWRRLKTILATYFAACIGAALAIYMLGMSYTAYQEDQLRQEYSNLLGSMNKSYLVFEKEFMSKRHPNQEIAPLPIADLSRSDILDRLEFIQKELKNSPDMFPLLPNLPRVSDVLAWLSSHPVIKPKNEDEGIKIESFNYSMVKRPEQKKKQEKYQAKVEFEFSSPTPKLARELHDALIAPNEFVDPKGEVKWSANKNKYRTSFFLKDKTSYTN